MDFYPNDFSAKAKARVETEQILAHQEFKVEKTKDQKPTYDREQRIISKEEALLQDHILRVFLMFAKEACALGHELTWTVDRISSEADEFLRRLTIYVYHQQGYGARCPTSNLTGSLNSDAEQRFKQSPQWREFEAILLEVAEFQANQQTSEQDDVASLEYVPHKPLSNPLIAEDRNGHCWILIDPFVLATIRGNVNIENAGSITGLAYNTLYYVYFDNPGLASQTSTREAVYNA